MTLRLYRISQQQKVAYNCIASAIVVAKDHKNARNTNPLGRGWYHCNNDIWENPRATIGGHYNYQWVNPDNVKVDEIGIASSNLEEGQVLCIQYYL